MACRAPISVGEEVGEKECEKEVEKVKARRKLSAIILSERRRVVIIGKFRTVPAHRLFCFAASRPVRAPSARPELAVSRFADSDVRTKSGQVAQVVERSPEKAGVGGSTPSLATTFQSSPPISEKPSSVFSARDSIKSLPRLPGCSTARWLRAFHPARL